MSDIAIQVENLGKQYRIGGPRARYKTIRESLIEMVQAPFRRAASLLRGQAYGAAEMDRTIWALKEISFDVRQGEVMGIIGRNGAGKTTLLKILSRITEPTEGRAEIHGRVGSLLEVGTGFHPELTGRENIYLNGAILGMKRAEIEHKFDEIVAFSEVEKFIDTPMKHFSSGMQVRLAFSVAAHLDPEILLVDEVLAVGDAQFQEKCLGKMGRVVQEGRTVLFVSHDMAAIRNLCGRTLLIESGRILVDGKTDLAIAKYLDRNLQEGAVAPAKQLAAKVEGVINRENPSVRLKEIALLDQRGRPRNLFRSDEDIQISVTYECITVVNDLRVVVHIEDEANTLILATENVDDVSNKEFYRQEPGLYRSVCVLPANTFGERRFYVTIHLIYPHVEHLVLGKVLSFEVEFRGYNNIQYKNRKHAWIRPQLSWLTQSLTRDHSISAE